MGMLPLLAFTQTIQRVENNGNLILEDIPPIPESIKSDLVQYQNVRSGAFRGFDQTGKIYLYQLDSGMLVSYIM